METNMGDVEIRVKIRHGYGTFIDQNDVAEMCREFAEKALRDGVNRCITSSASTLTIVEVTLESTGLRSDDLELGDEIEVTKTFCDIPAGAILVVQGHPDAPDQRFVMHRGVSRYLIDLENEDGVLVGVRRAPPGPSNPAAPAEPF